MGQHDDRHGDNGHRDKARAFDLPVQSASSVSPSFDGYDLLDVPLGDLLRGERATLGKSLLDVERELRIRATYIAAIENGDVGAFQSQGFIAGYVRSYGRYLGIDPEWTFRRFCDETGFRGIHGAGASQGSAVKRSIADAPRRLDPNEVMSSARISFAPKRESLFANVQPGALGSIAVLLVLVTGIGYGAMAIFNDIQRLQIAPIDEAPNVPLAQLDPLAGATDGAFDGAQGFDIAVPGPEAVERLYRPQALEAPMLTPRDGALATLDPDAVGTLGTLDSAASAIDTAPGAAPEQVAQAPVVQVTQPLDQVLIFATRPTWVRVTSPTGATIYEATLDAGDSYVIPESEGTPLLRSGNAGSLYFAVNGVALGPAGEGASIVRDVELTADALSANFQMADTEADPDLTEVASLVFDANALPAAPVEAAQQAAVAAATTQSLVYNPTGGAAAPQASPYQDLPADVAASLVASNALPVVVQTPSASDIRPQQRP